MNITNLAGLDLPSLNLEALMQQDPALWDKLCSLGYKVVMPDQLGKSMREQICRYIEVGETQSKGYMWHLEEGCYLGKTFVVAAEPCQAVTKLVSLLDLVGQEEAVSGVEERSARPQVEYVEL